MVKITLNHISLEDQWFLLITNLEFITSKVKSFWVQQGHQISRNYSAWSMGNQVNTSQYSNMQSWASEGCFQIQIAQEAPEFAPENQLWYKVRHYKSVQKQMLKWQWESTVVTVTPVLVLEVWLNRPNTKKKKKVDVYSLLHTKTGSSCSKTHCRDKSPLLQHRLTASLWQFTFSYLSL